MSIKIGNVTLCGNVILAPMAGFGDVAFRRLCRDYGAALTTTEMISAKGLLYNSKKTIDMLRLAPNETPSSVQLFGSDPDDFYNAAQREELAHFDIIDINMGCPAKKVVSNGEGSALMRDFDRARKIIKAAVAGANGRPVTVKFRAGFYDDDICAEEFASMAEEAGAAAMTVHGRTAEQGYSGFADWDIICRVAQQVNVPVFGNGDVKKNNLKDRLLLTEGVAIGRGAIGNCDIFSLGKKDASKKQMLLTHIRYMTEYFGSRFTAVNIRKHLPYYFAGNKDLKLFRARLNTLEDAEQMYREVEACAEFE